MKNKLIVSVLKLGRRKFVFYSIFDKWKGVFYSKAAQFERQNPMPQKISKWFPSLIDVKNKYLREQIKQLKHEIKQMINVHQYTWRICMNLAFSIFFPKPTDYKKILLSISIILFLITLTLVYCFHTLLIQIGISNTVTDSMIALLSVNMKPNKY